MVSSTIDRKDLARDIGSSITEKEDCRVFNILHVSKTTGWDSGPTPRSTTFRRQAIHSFRPSDRSWGNNIRAYSMRTFFGSQDSRQCVDSSLRGRDVDLIGCAYVATFILVFRDVNAQDPSHLCNAVLH